MQRGGSGSGSGNGSSKVLPTDDEARPEGIDATRRSGGSSSASGEGVIDSNDEAIYSDADYNDEEDEERGNLTRQLAETAVSVREMSKQLGKFPRLPLIPFWSGVDWIIVSSHRSRPSHYANPISDDRHESSR